MKKMIVSLSLMGAILALAAPAASAHPRHRVLPRPHVTLAPAISVALPGISVTVAAPTPGLPRAQFAAADRNHDGFVDAYEWMMFFRTDDGFRRADRNGDGRIDLYEWLRIP